jgi:thioredoxin 1
VLTMSKITSVTASTFQDEVFNSEQLVLVDFWAPWCAPCKAITPHLERLAGENESQVKVVKVNIQEELDLAKQMGIRNIPTLFMFQGGQKVGEKTGAAGGYPALKSFIDSFTGESNG